MNTSTTPSFLTIATIHRADISWWWTHAYLHNMDYRIDVNAKVLEKVTELCKRYKVVNDTGYCTQYEGVLLESENLDDLTKAGTELATYMKQFKGLQPLDAF